MLYLPDLSHSCFQSCPVKFSAEGTSDGEEHGAVTALEVFKKQLDVALSALAQ